ncbi:hypothetical protein Glove_505g24 [Diversispora epigaea]|uniref:Uncharacterized protein n=1 Tax=Diversispora epigaea TaxID=1348612 RepID=A0A397GQ11_9GLOM|nr:hypothetical protein Glove_505g24 [Diversispora epigaea]
MSANNVHQEGVVGAARLLGGSFDDNDNKSLHDNAYYHSQPPPKFPTNSSLTPPQQPKQFVAFLLLNTEFPSFYEEVKRQEDATRIKSIAYFIYQKQYIDYLEQQKIKTTRNIQENIETKWENESKSIKEKYLAFASECEKLYLKAKGEQKSVQLQALRLQSQELFIGGETIGKYDFHLFSNNNQLSVASSTTNSPQPENFDNFFPPLSSIQPRPPSLDYYDDDTLPEDMGPSLF